MKMTVKKYEELTRDELYEILKVRVNVFVVEQNCPYPEIDDKDKYAYHVYMEDEEGIQAYLRVFAIDKRENSQLAAIGRVLSLKRRQGFGTLILKEGIRVASEVLSADKIVIEAQVYARRMYENLGFVQTSEEFLEDGIPHIKMELEVKSHN